MVERIAGNTLIEQKERDVLPQLTPYEQTLYVKLREQAVKIEVKNPNLDTSVNTRYLQEFLEAGAKHRRELDDYRKRAASQGIVPDAGYIGRMSVKMQQEFIDGFANDVLPQYGDQGKLANAKLMNAMKGKTIPGLITEQFYRNEEGGEKNGLLGGFRVSGILAALAGGLFIFSKMGGMAGGPVGFITTAIAALGAAWLVNKGVDTTTDIIEARRARNTPPGKEQAAAKERDKPVHVANKREKPVLPELGELVPNQTFESQHVDDGQAFTLNPMNSPAKPQANANNKTLPGGNKTLVG